jgi:hypothetical protein
MYKFSPLTLAEGNCMTEQVLRTHWHQEFLFEFLCVCLANYLPWLSLNHDPPDLCLLSSQDYRHEPPAPSLLYESLLFNRFRQFVYFYPWTLFFKSGYYRLPLLAFHDGTMWPSPLRLTHFELSSKVQGFNFRVKKHEGCLNH